jgi:hypothetical protein
MSNICPCSDHPFKVYTYAIQMRTLAEIGSQLAQGCSYPCVHADDYNKWDRSSKLECGNIWPSPANGKFVFFRVYPNGCASSSVVESCENLLLPLRPHHQIVCNHNPIHWLACDRTHGSVSVRFGEMIRDFYSVCIGIVQKHQSMIKDMQIRMLCMGNSDKVAIVRACSRSLQTYIQLMRLCAGVWRRVPRDIARLIHYYVFKLYIWFYGARI